MTYKRLNRKTIYTSEWINLHCDKVETENGSIIEKYHQLDYPKESVVIIVHKNDKVCLIKSYRYTFKDTNIELPAGYIEAGENIITAAIREVKEETGLKIDNPDPFFSFFPSNGISNQKVHVYIANTNSKIQKPESHEGIQDVFWASTAKLLQLIKNNEISDGITLLALSRFLLKLKGL